MCIRDRYITETSKESLKPQLRGRTPSGSTETQRVSNIPKPVPPATKRPDSRIKLGVNRKNTPKDASVERKLEENTPNGKSEEEGGDYEDGDIVDVDLSVDDLYKETVSLKDLELKYKQLLEKEKEKGKERQKVKLSIKRNSSFRHFLNNVLFICGQFQLRMIDAILQHSLQS
eukprot:TRINITY_DN6816_c0_g1_i13.p2 TRINITY_DN6816_c0_g1~~TRINITY_DN6816_c0_g1_i13.p2  ORF type:complete len:193 (-),score=33.53 TRINITY_DN6816_c0_g1_i13:121-639(-)